MVQGTLKRKEYLRVSIDLYATCPDCNMPDKIQCAQYELQGGRKELTCYSCLKSYEVEWKAYEGIKGGRTMGQRNVKVHFNDGRSPRIFNQGHRSGGSYSQGIKYEGEFVIIRSVDDEEVAFPATCVKEVEVRQNAFSN